MGDAQRHSAHQAMRSRCCDDEHSQPMKTKSDPRRHTKGHEENPWFEQFRVLSWIVLSSG